MDNLHWTAISGIAGIVAVIGLITLLLPSAHTGAVPSGPTLSDTGGICVPNWETGCALPGSVDCCWPSQCVTRVGKVYIERGMCSIRASTSS